MVLLYDGSSGRNKSTLFYNTETMRCSHFLHRISSWLSNINSRCTQMWRKIIIQSYGELSYGEPTRFCLGTFLKFKRATMKQIRIRLLIPINKENLHRTYPQTISTLLTSCSANYSLGVPLAASYKTLHSFCSRPGSRCPLILLVSSSDETAG